MYEDIYGHCPTCNRLHWRDEGCDSDSKPFWSWDREAEERKSETEDEEPDEENS